MEKGHGEARLLVIEKRRILPGGGRVVGKLHKFIRTLMMQKERLPLLRLTCGTVALGETNTRDSEENDIPRVPIRLIYLISDVCQLSSLSATESWPTGFSVIRDALYRAAAGDAHQSIVWHHDDSQHVLRIS